MVSSPGTRPTPRVTPRTRGASPACPRHVDCSSGRVRAVVLPLLTAALLIAGRAGAQTAAERSEARRYFEAGNEAYAAGQYLLAARAFEEARERAPMPEITFSTAQAYRLAYYQDRRPETLRRALELYRRYLDEAPRGRRRSHATLHIEAIEGLLGGGAAPSPAAPSPESKPAEPPAPVSELMVTSRVPGARGRIDGGDLVELPFSKRVEPGKRRVVVEAPGHEPASGDWLAVEGRLVVAQVQLEPRPARLRVTAPAGAQIVIDDRLVGMAPLRGPVSVSAGQHVVRVSLRGHRPLAQRAHVERGHTSSVDAGELAVTDQRVISHFAFGGAAVLAVAGVTTGVLALSAQARVQRYDESRTHETKTASELSDRNRDLEARDDLRTATYLLLGGAVAVGATGALLWWADTPGAETKASALGPWVGRDMLGLGWSGRYH